MFTAKSNRLVCAYHATSLYYLLHWRKALRSCFLTRLLLFSFFFFLFSLAHNLVTTIII